MKELKRLTELSNCKHLNKTDRDCITWAIFQIQPPEVDPETGFNGFEFSSWPSVPDKKIFAELTKARKAKKKVIMTQSYIDLAAPHLHELSNNNVTVNEALTVAAVHGWQGLRANWVLNELKANEAVKEEAPKTINDYMKLIMDDKITSVSQIEKNNRKMIETHLRIGKFSVQTEQKLYKIGFAL
ncbi:MAG: hypothetical protein MJK15_03145 [Colwellia sp.]|nr:hypothetical protein [Colwellia sp.]